MTDKAKNEDIDLNDLVEFDPNEPQDLKRVISSLYESNLFLRTEVRELRETVMKLGLSIKMSQDRQGMLSLNISNVLVHFSTKHKEWLAELSRTVDAVVDAVSRTTVGVDPNSKESAKNQWFLEVFGGVLENLKIEDDNEAQEERKEGRDPYKIIKDAITEQRKIMKAEVDKTEPAIKKQ